MRKAFAIAKIICIPLAALVAIIWIFFALKPTPPDRVISLFVKDLHNHKCPAAYKFVAEEWKQNDPDVEELSDFQRNFCDYTEGAFTKMFVDPNGMDVKTIGGRSTVDYYLCTLPPGFIRRVCVRQQTTLTKEGLKWRLISFEVRMHTAHDFTQERPEELIKKDSPWKHPVLPRIFRSEKSGGR